MLALFACQADPVDLQLAPDFANRLTRGFACPGPSGVVLLDDDATVRLQIHGGPNGTPGAAAFVGERLDAVFADGNGCDDVIIISPGDRQQSIRMAWRGTFAAYDQVDGADGRVVEVRDLELTPDPEYEQGQVYESVVVGTLTLGVVPIGGTIAPIVPL